MLRSYFSINCRHDRESQRATERVYELFVKDPNKTLNYETLQKATEEIGDKTPDEDLQILLRMVLPIVLISPMKNSIPL